MADYEKLYKILFNGITDAIEDMDKLEYASAKDKLINIQQKSEEMYISTEILEVGA